MKEIKLSKGSSLSIEEKGDCIIITQKYKKCRCRTIDEIKRSESIIRRHLKTKQNCGENCLRYRLTKNELDDN